MKNNVFLNINSRIKSVYDNIKKWEVNAVIFAGYYKYIMLCVLSLSPGSETDPSMTAECSCFFFIGRIRD